MDREKGVNLSKDRRDDEGVCAMYVNDRSANEADVLLLTGYAPSQALCSRCSIGHPLLIGMLGFADVETASIPKRLRASKGFLFECVLCV